MVFVLICHSESQGCGSRSYSVKYDNNSNYFHVLLRLTTTVGVNRTVLGSITDQDTTINPSVCLCINICGIIPTCWIQESGSGFTLSNTWILLMHHQSLKDVKQPPVNN